MIKFYEGPYHQNGAGFGGFFKGLMNIVRPIASVLKPVITSPITQKIAKEVVRTGIGIGNDMVSGKSFNESAKENLGKAKKRVASAVFDSLKSRSDDEDEDTPEHMFKKSRPTKKRMKTKKTISSKFRTILD